MTLNGHSLNGRQFRKQASDFLAWAYGTDASTMFNMGVTTLGQRVGQSFMNALREFDIKSYAHLAGSSFDPFYVDEKIPAAIDKLTSK